MTASRHISPTTGDYTIRDGAPIGDATTASEVVLALRSRRGECGADPTFGSRLHTIKKLTPAARRLAQVYGREAIQHLIDRNEVRAPTFTAAVDESTFCLSLTVAYTDRAGRRQTLPVTVPLT